LLARVEWVQYSDELIPDIAGRWRPEPIQIGNHVPPEHFLVLVLMRD